MTLNKKDFQSSNEVRWCPGCGDYAILATVQKTLAELNIDRDNTVFVSGIGCAARMPYYMNTYGLHTIHGRGPAFAFGIKLANPSLNVFLITGDGDGLSIGASHLMHLFRRNINITVLMFNNQIYGLTKGQYSPTSARGHIAKSTPFGSLEEPINPLAFAVSGNASFVARTIDNDAQHMSYVLKEAIEHKGTSFIEILQNCVVFNDGAFSTLRDKSIRDEKILWLKENQPMLFAQEKKAIVLDADLNPKTANSDSPGVLIHTPRLKTTKTQIVANFNEPNLPTPMGILQKINRPTYEELKQGRDLMIRKPTDLQQVLNGNNTWTV